MYVIDVEVQCPFCGDKSTVACNSDGYKAWLDGAYVQVALPTLTASERERLMTGICDPCWDESFGEEG